MARLDKKLERIGVVAEEKKAQRKKNNKRKEEERAEESEAHGVDADEDSGSIKVGALLRGLVLRSSLLCEEEAIEKDDCINVFDIETCKKGCARGRARHAR